MAIAILLIVYTDSFCACGCDNRGYAYGGISICSVGGGGCLVPDADNRDGPTDLGVKWEKFLELSREDFT